MVTDSRVSYRPIHWLRQPAGIEPLIVLRIVLGFLLFISTARFLGLGWVEAHYLAPQVHFTYFGFEWIRALPPFWMYAIHILMLLAALGVMLGLFFRLSVVVLFLLFSYTELIDITYYLNHYYFVSIILFLLIFSPANRSFSLDVKRRPEIAVTHIPRFWIVLFQGLLILVYTYAGLAKINHDWLIEALPLKIWLPAQDKLPVIGALFTWKYLPYVFSWTGMLYDCTIAFWLINRRTRPVAYLLVIAFHLLTGILFQIGVFPVVMIGATLIFFSEEWHSRLISRMRRWLNVKAPAIRQNYRPVSTYSLIFFGLFFVFQVIFPWRYLLYPGDIFWNEEGYRFSWRVMLMEKAGTATFYVKDGKDGREGMVDNRKFLNAHQEKQMAMQPDMILQFAHYLADSYRKKGMNDPQVRAEVYVTLNARPSKLLIDPSVNLAVVDDGWQHKQWILTAHE